jgi:3-oxoacyl-[acyl-carrier-protein] synthase-3
MRRAQVGTRDVDAYVFHQANRYIIRNIARRLHLPLERVPMDIVERFGNQSSASIPFTLCHSLGEAARARRLRVLLVGYGVGLSWASALLEVGPLRVCEWITGVAPP